MKRLADRTILITGAARGLGKEIAARCAQEGARLILTDVLQAEGAATARDLVAGGADAAFHRCDITSPNDLAEIAQAIKERWGCLDGLVNNAALATRLAGRAFDELDEELSGSRLRYQCQRNMDDDEGRGSLASRRKRRAYRELIIGHRTLGRRSLLALRSEQGCDREHDARARARAWTRWNLRECHCAGDRRDRVRPHLRRSGAGSNTGQASFWIVARRHAILRASLCFC